MLLKSVIVLLIYYFWLHFHAGKCQLMQSIFQKENADKALKYRLYRHLPAYEKIIRKLVSFSQPKKISDETRNIDLTKYKRHRHEERTRPAAPHSLQHRSVSSVGSQPISHTPAHEPDVTWRCETGFNPSLSRPSSTRPSNALDLEPSCAVFFAFSITHRIKTHGPYTPKCEGPVMTRERL